MSTSNNEVKEMLDELAETLLVLVQEKYEVMPNDAKPQAIWTMLAEMTDGIIGACKQLVTMSGSISPNMILEGTQKGARDEARREESIVKGVQRSSIVYRNVIFDEECRDLPPPRKNLDPSYHQECTARTLHEMIFVDSDCFSSLSNIQPGSHGWIIIFRDELKDWLLSAEEPFHVSYEDDRRKRTYFGIYTARLLARASMNGAEFACLEGTVREIIITALSRSGRGSKPYDSMTEDLLSSLKTLPCVFLQCVEFLPVMYPNFMTDIAQLVQPVPKTLAPSRPPGLPSPVRTPVKRESRPTSSLPSQLPTAPVSLCGQYQSTRSCQEVFQPEDNDKTPRVQGTSTPSTTVKRGGKVLYATSSSYDGRSHSVSDPDKTPKGPSKVLARQQTWHQDHQNNNLVNLDRNLGSVPRICPQPLQSSARSNSQPRDLQSNPSSVSHNSVGLKVRNTELRYGSQSQLHFATYRAPRGYQVQNQNINPICNPLPVSNPQITRLSSLHPPNGYYSTTLLSQNFPFPRHGTTDPRFRDSQSYRKQRIQ